MSDQQNPLAIYRALKQSNPYAAAQFRQANALALRAAEEAEHPEQHKEEIARREEQAAAMKHETDRARAGVEITKGK